MNANQKIEQIRLLMKKHKITAVVVPSDDPHKSEYVAEHWQTRKWLTGFSGSAGTAVVTHDQAILWTDFRYYIQAEQQINASPFVLFKMGVQEVPTVQKWLTDTLTPGDTIGLDGKVFCRSDIKKLETVFNASDLLLDTTFDKITDLWTDRPPIPVSKAYLFSEKYTGKKRTDKINAIRKEMKAANTSYHLMSTLDDIAWTLNLRGKDVHTNPVNIAFVLIGPEKATLFAKNEKFDEDLVKVLKKDNIDLMEYEDIYTALSDLEKDCAILIDPDNTNYRLFQSIPKTCKVIEKSTPAIALKSVKNDTEINHLRQTAAKDGAAVVNFLYWLEHQDEDMTEVSVATALYGFRKDQEAFVDNSFDPIMAFEAHSAMCHYSATPETDVIIGKKGMFLTDSGGNYLTGTTDITRTVFRGEPSRQQVTDYTLVLKGHIAVATTLFPKGTRGFQIDTLSRQFLWNQGADFGHGTGHGVGFFLCVHEGPARISPHPVDVKLEKGMVLTNEPGLYREGAYGIRLENMILVDQAFENEFGTFLKFENLTWCHFEKTLVDTAMLSENEKSWINAYHAGVYETLAPVLDKDVAAWLREKTSPL